jgi:hypothetical protein
MANILSKILFLIQSLVFDIKHRKSQFLLLLWLM